jgi:hypothetical protein
MQSARRAGEGAAIAGLVVVVASLWASLFACRDPRASDGAGGQSGDEGRTPRSQGTGGGAADLLTPR